MHWDLILFAGAGLGLMAASLFAGKAALRRSRASEKSRDRLMNFWLFGTSVFVGLCVSEGLRRFLYSDVKATGENMSYFSRRWYAENVVRNSLGFREREVSSTRLPGVFRLAVIGDSFTFGQGVVEEERFTNTMNRRLNDAGPKFEVPNFGEGGAETIDHIRILDDAALPANPDFVLLQWFTNDVEGHDKSKRPWAPNLIPIDWVSNLLQKTSAAYYVVNRGWKDILTFIGLGPEYTYEEYMLRRFADPNSRDSREAGMALERFIAVCRERQVPVGIVLFPHPDDDLTRDDAPFAFLFQRVLDLCLQTETPCLDLRPILAPVRPVERLRVGRFDSHPGPLANRLAAEAILEKFSQTWRALREQRDPSLATPR